PGALHHRPRVHDDRVGHAPGRAREPAAQAARDAAGPDEPGLRPVPNLQRRADRGRRRDRRRPLARLRAHAGRRADPGRSRQPAHGRVARDQHRAPVHADLRVRQRHGGAGGGLGAEFLGLDPQYALKYLVYFLIVVAVGGLGRVSGVFWAALLIGVLDFTLKKYVPQGGTAFIYALTILLLLWRPQGLFSARSA